MGLFNFFKRSRASPNDNINKKLNAFIAGADLDSNATSIAGAHVDEDSSLKISAVYACVKVISETVASLPLKLLKHETNGDTTKATAHPLYDLIADCPNNEMTAFTFREMMMTNLLLWGNAYAHIRRNRAGQIAELYPLRASNMEVFRCPQTQNIRYRYTCDKDNQTVIYRPRQIFHISAFSFDGVVGVSPITYAREAFGLALATEEFGARWFSSGGRPSGILQHPGTIKDPDRVRDAFNKTYKGNKNAHKIFIAEEGMEYKSISMSPNDSQFLETRSFQLNEICRIFRVPPHMIGDLTRSTFSNIEHQSIDFVVHTIRPWLVRWEQAIKKSLLTETERTIYHAKFKVDGLLRGDFNSRMQGYAVARQNGWMSANEIRALEDMNQIPAELGGDDYKVNGNMINLANLNGADNGGNNIE